MTDRAGGRAAPMEITAPRIGRVRTALTGRLAASARLLLAPLAVLCAWLAQHPGDPDAVPSWVIAASLLAILGGALAFPDPLRAGTTQPADPTSDPHPGTERDSPGSFLLLGLLLALPAAGAALVWLQEPFATYHAFINGSSTVAAYIWLGGIALGLLLALPIGAGQRHTLFTRRRWLLLEILALVVVLDLAVGLRIYHLAMLPEGVWFDEADSAHNAEFLLRLPFQAYAPANVGHNPSLYFYLMAALLHVGGKTVAAVRLTSVIFGLVAVVGVYWVGRRAGGVVLGLVAATLLAASHWAINFSRLGMPDVAAPAMLGLGLGALCTAMIRPRAFWFALSGVLLGFALLTYQGAFATALVAIVVVAVRLLSDRSFRPAAWPAVLLLPLGLLVGAAPLLVASGLDPAYAVFRVQKVSLLNEYPDPAHFFPALGTNIHRHLLMFTVAGDSNGRHNLPGGPMLDAVTGACTLLGLGIALRRIAHWFYQLLLLWFLAAMGGGVLSLAFEAPQSARSIGAIAPICLLASLPLVALARGIQVLLTAPLERLARARPLAGSRRWGMGMASVAAVVALLIPLGIAAAQNADEYFNGQAGSLRSWSEMDGLQAILGREAASLTRAGYTVRIIPSLAGDPMVAFTDGNVAVPGFDAAVPVTLPVPRGGLALLVPIDRPDVLDFVRQSYPTVRMLPLAPAFDPGLTKAVAVLIAPSDTAASAGVRVRIGTSVREHLQGPIAWPAGANIATALRLDGTLIIPTSLSWQPLALRLVGIRQASIAIDGQTWRNAAATTSLIRLGAGNHALRVEAQGRGNGPAQLLLNTPTSPYGEGSTLQTGTGDAPFTATYGWLPVPSWMLLAPEMPTGGLLGLYFGDPTVGNDLKLVRTDRTISTYYQTSPVYGLVSSATGFPFSVRWLGALRIATGGSYTFKLESTGPSALRIDGRTLIPTGGVTTEGTASIALSAGSHDIQVDYSATGSYLHCYLSWAPPGQGYTPIPASATWPAHG